MGKGRTFIPLKTLRDMYERVVVHGERSADLPVEYEASVKGGPEEDDHRRGWQCAL